jgi:hypothetical protein
MHHEGIIMTDTPEKPKRFLSGLTIRFDPHVRVAIDKAAKADKRSASSLVEIAVMAYLREKGFLTDDQ